MNELEARRGPGRPPKYQEATTEAAPPVAPARPKRKPFGELVQKLAYPERPAFHRHWFNDVGNRIARAEEAGYTHVSDNDGKRICRIVGTLDGGGPLHAYLMEIPEEYYKEDMNAQQEHINAKEKAMKSGALESQQGDGRYVPSQGISIKHGS